MKKTQQNQQPVHSEDQFVIKSLLFSMVPKPKNIFDIKIVNVFEDKYRVNVWTKVDHENIEKNKIEASYFLKYDGEKIEIKF